MERPAIERVMVITAHPDDSEFGAGGTVAKHAKDGREVTYVIATNGNKGSSDRTMTPERLARIRETEQRNAARVLGVERVEFLGYEDGELEDTRDLRRDVTGAPSGHQERRKACLRTRMNVRSVRDQCLRDLRVSFGRRPHQRRLSSRPPDDRRGRARLHLSARPRSHGVSRADARVRAPQGP